MSSNQAATAGSGGVGFLGLLALLFIGLKLGGVIDWGWWLVLLPLWGPAAFFLALVIVLLLVAITLAAAGAKMK